MKRNKLTETQFDKLAEKVKRKVKAAAGPDAGVAESERVRREDARNSLLSFTKYTKPDYETNWHHEAICRYLERFVSGDIRRLMLFVPPRHGKSELGSRRLPAYILGKKPDAQIIATSYAADLAQRINRDVQRIMDTPEYAELFPATMLSGQNVSFSSKGSWLRTSDIFEIVDRKGAYRSAGVGGGITGMGADFAIIDDPIKNRADANSETLRNRIWEWYTSTLLTRLEKGGRVLMILTRWHDDDLAGRALKLAADDPGSDQWTVVSFPAILEDETANPEDPRQIGEALWPNKYSIKELEQRKRTLGTYDWNSLYQQSPMPLEGGLLKMHWFKRYAVRGQYRRIVQSWDTALKAEKSNDYSVCTTWGDAGTWFDLLDVYRKRLEYPELERMVPELAKQWNASAILIEDKGSGTSLIQSVRRKSRVPVVACMPESDKQTRAMIISPRLESGQVRIPDHAHWVGDFLDEIGKFPQAKHDDQVDSLTQFLQWASVSQPVEYQGIFKRIFGKGTY